VDDIAATAAFIEARLAELEWTARHSGPHRVAWLTLYRPDGSLHYTTTGAELGPLGDNQGWCADGRELPASTTAMVVYDPAAVLRDVAAKRAILDMCRKTLAVKERPPSQAAPGTMEAWLRAREHLDAERELCALEPVVLALAAIDSDHPDYRQEWADE
jgi:hypothetical protein